MQSVQTWLIHFQIGSQLRGNQGQPIKLAVVKVGVLWQLNLAMGSPWKYSHLTIRDTQIIAKYSKNVGNESCYCGPFIIQVTVSQSQEY